LHIGFQFTLLIGCTELQHEIGGGNKLGFDIAHDGLIGNL